MTAALTSFENLFRRRCFPAMAGGSKKAVGSGPAAMSPSCPARRLKKSARSAARCSAGCALVSGREGLRKAIELQKRPAVLDGVEPSSGPLRTVGRYDWRGAPVEESTEAYAQRARSVGDAITANLLELSCWQAEVQTRFLHQDDVSVQPWLVSACDRIAAALLQDAASDTLHAPLSAAQAPANLGPFQEDCVGALCAAFAQGKL